MDAILGLFQNPVVLQVVMFVWGLVVKYVPALEKVPNTLIPWMNFVIALLAQIGGPQTAHAAGFGGAVVGFFAPIVKAGVSAA
jgi:hypothetical protein